MLLDDRSSRLGGRRRHRLVKVFKAQCQTRDAAR